MSILVVEDEALVREPIGIALRAAGYDVRFAKDAATARRAIAAAAPLLVLLDIDLGGESGIELLRWLRGDSRRSGIRVLMLSNQASMDSVFTAMGCGADDFLRKSAFTLHGLLRRIEGIIGRPGAAGQVAASGARTPTSATSEGRPRAIEDPTPLQVAAVGAGSEHDARVVRHASRAFPGVVAEIIRICGSADATRDDLVATLRHDPVLSARVLQSSNAASAARKSLASIEEAVAWLGFSAVRDLAASVGVFASMPSGPIGRFEPLRCLQHCLAVARVLEGLEQRGGGAAQSYLVGLFHDIGHLLVRESLADRFAAIDAEPGPAGGREAAERRVLGRTSAELACLSLDAIGLSAELTAPIKNLMQDRARYARGSLSYRLHWANAFAHALQFTWCADAELPCLSIDEGSALVVVDDWAAVRDTIGETSRGVFAAVGRSAPSRSARPPTPPRAVTMRYPRATAIGPLRLAVSQLAVVEHRTEPPASPADWPSCPTVIIGGDEPDWDERIVRSLRDRGTRSPVLLLGMREDRIGAVPPETAIRHVATVGCLQRLLGP